MCNTQVHSTSHNSVKSQPNSTIETPTRYQRFSAVGSKTSGVDTSQNNGAGRTRTVCLISQDVRKQEYTACCTRTVSQSTNFDIDPCHDMYINKEPSVYRDYIHQYENRAEAEVFITGVYISIYTRFLCYNIFIPLHIHRV